jgi:hypothetical protein
VRRFGERHRPVGVDGDVAVHDAHVLPELEDGLAVHFLERGEIAGDVVVVRPGRLRRLGLGGAETRTRAGCKHEVDRERGGESVGPVSR